MSQSPSRPSPRSGARPYRPAALVFLLGTLLTLITFLGARHAEERRRKSEFKERASRPVAALQQQLNLYLEELQSIGRFYAASHLVERAEFHAFVQDILRRRPAIDTLEWAPCVPREQRAAFEAAARRELGESFQIVALDEKGRQVPAGRRDYYYPVWYVEPGEHAAASLGFDLGSSPRYQEALQAAQQWRSLAATRPVGIEYEGRMQSGVAVMLPVFYGDILDNDSGLHRPDQLYGLVVAVLRIGDLVEEALESIRVGRVDIRLLEARGEEVMVIYPYPNSPDRESEPAAEAELGDGLRHSAAVYLADRRWRMECVPTPDYLATTRSWMAWAVLAVGLLFTGLLTAYVTSVVGRAAWAEQLVAERTAELSQANTRLQGEIRERTHAQEELTARNRELESFVYTASHDLRTPLVGIEGFARLLEEEYADRLDDAGREYLDRVRANAGNMEALLSDLLELSRVTRTGEAKEPVSVAAVVARAVQDLQPFITASQAEVVVPEDLPTVWAGPTRLRQVFTNLISNGIKFAREGVPPRVEVSWRRTPEGYRFEVADNGIGIPQEYQSQVFELFSRLKEKDVPGTGIGLAIVKRIVEGFGGAVGVESAVGQGSTFWFTLPEEGGNGQGQTREPHMSGD